MICFTGSGVVLTGWEYSQRDRVKVAVRERGLADFHLRIATGLTSSPSLYVDGQKVAATYDATTGTLTPVNPLSEGGHQLSYTLTDAAGNESAPSGAMALTTSTSAPAKPWI